jgi:hypothetical protein
VAEDLKITNKIQVKRGTGKPGPEVLDEGELGYDTEGKVLYIGNKEGDHSQVGNGFIDISQVNNTLTFSKADGTSTSATISLKDLGITTSVADINNLNTTINNINTTLNSKVPNTRKVNNKTLSTDITLSASDVGAVPTSRTVNNKALNSNITLSASDVGARPSTWIPSASDITSGTLAIARGGTGASKGADGLKNLFAAGNTILSSY